MAEGETAVAKEESSEQSGQPSTNITHTHSTTPVMSNTLANLRACVKEFDPEQTADLINVAKRYEDWLENFEACADFEDVTVAKRKPALMALGGEKFRQLCKTLDITAAAT